MGTDIKKQFQLDNFEGPLDLLLFLIKRNEINIYNISVAEIVSQYLEAIHNNSLSDIEDASEFYFFATTLVYIKSRVLLPFEADFEDYTEDPRQNLIDQLIEYQKFKKLTELIANRQKTWSIERPLQQRRIPLLQEEQVVLNINIEDLHDMFINTIRQLAPEQVLNLYENVSINEKLTLIQEKIQHTKRFNFTELLTRPNSRMDIICAFLALLESVKRGVISIEQEQFLGNIHIYTLGVQNEARL